MLSCCLPSWWCSVRLGTPSILQFKVSCTWRLAFLLLWLFWFLSLKQKQTKTLLVVKLQKVKIAILEDSHWGSPGTLKELFVALGKLYLLECSDLQDQSRSRRSSQDLSLSLQTQKSKMSLFLVSVWSLLLLIYGFDRVFNALSSGIPWILTVFS